jgi:FAD/FMN-containing dehydrogenase
VSDEWSNWARQQRCRPREVLVPSDEAALADAVRRAADAGRTVRPVGSGHSFTALCVTDDVQVDLSRLDRVIDLDARGVARVQAGITLHALSAELHRHGRALENMGDVDTQTLAGALATGTHGTGARFANLSAQMVGGRLVTADGPVLDVGSDPELLLAARVSLGALGTLSEIDLQTVPAFRLHKVEEVRPLEELLADLDDLVAGHDHVELYALPWSTRALLLRTRRTEEPADPPPRWRTWLTDELVNNAGLDLLQRTGRRSAGSPACSRRAASGSTTATGCSRAAAGCGSPSRSGPSRGPYCPMRCAECSR